MVQFLLDCGTNVPSQIARGMSALHMACEEGNAQVVKVLLQVIFEPWVFSGSNGKAI